MKNAFVICQNAIHQLLQHWISVIAIGCLAFSIGNSLQGMESLLLIVVGVYLWYAAFFVIVLIGVFVEKKPYPAKFRIAPLDRNVFAACFLLSASVALTEWPMRTAFHISRSALETEAKAIEKGKSANYPRFVGLFWVRQAEISPFSKTACFWVDTDPLGRTGFVQGNPEKAQHFNLWHTASLADNWQLVSED